MSGLRWAPFICDGIRARDFSHGKAYAHDDTLMHRILDAREPCVVVCGVFDGIHVGHRTLLHDAVARAHGDGVPCVVATFDPDPGEVLGQSEAVARLLSCEDRVSGLLSIGADIVLVYAFTRAFASLEPEQFVRARLLAATNPQMVFVGSNFRYGRGGEGNAGHLSLLGTRMGFGVVTHELEQRDGEVVSATRIRSLIAQGRLEEANGLLHRCHYVRGTVEHGRGAGTGFGFPTANVACEPHACMPAEGVYACYVICGTHAWPAAVNVGAPPTFLQHKSHFLEASLVGFEGDLYGCDVCVSFVAWLRASRTFQDIDELTKVVLGNIQWVRQHLGEDRTEVTA